MPLIIFKAQPYAIGSWIILPLPRAASAKLPSRGQVMVKGTVNGAPFQTALEPDGRGGHWLHVDKKLQTSANLDKNSMAALALESTKDWPEPTIPADIKAGIVQNPRLHDLWMDVTPMARWEWIRWIGATNNSETRQRRIEVAGSKLRNGLRRPCCFNRNMCCVPQVAKNGVLLEPSLSAK